MKIYLIRHGEVAHNINKVATDYDEDLTVNGVSEAQHLLQSVQNIDYDLIYSSPLQRTLHTAKIINYLNKPIITDKRLIERLSGSLSGHHLEGEDYETYWNYYSLNQYGTAEDLKLFLQRVYSFLDELKTNHYDTIIIVTHSGVSRAFYTYFNSIPSDGKLLSLSLKNCEMKTYYL